MTSNRRKKQSVVHDVLDEYNDSELFASWQGLSTWDVTRSDGGEPVLRETKVEDPQGTDISAQKRGWIAEYYAKKSHAAKIWWYFRKDWPERSPLHKVFLMLHILSVASCFRMVLSQVMPIVFKSEVSTLEVFLRVQITIYCMIFMAAELEIRVPYIRKKRDGILDTFFARGFCYIFIAIIGVMEGTADEGVDAMKRAREAPGSIPDSSFFLALLVQLSSWMLLIAGLLYMILGACCMEKQKRQCQAEYREKVNIFLNDMKSPRLGRLNDDTSPDVERTGSCEFGDQALGSRMARIGSCDFGQR